MGWTVKNRCMGANEACLAVTYNRFNIKLNASDSEIELIGQIVCREFSFFGFDETERYGRGIPKKLLPCRNTFFLITVVSAEKRNFIVFYSVSAGFIEVKITE